MATSETSGRVTLAVVLLAAGTSWNAGNIGPVTSTLSDDFSVSLTAIGLLSGTVFFAGILFSAGARRAPGGVELSATPLTPQSMPAARRMRG